MRPSRGLLESEFWPVLVYSSQIVAQDQHPGSRDSLPERFKIGQHSHFKHDQLGICALRPCSEILHGVQKLKKNRVGLNWDLNPGPLTCESCTQSKN